MGLEVEEAFPALIQNKLDSAMLGYNVINAGLSGETTASGKNRLSWLLKQKVDVFVYFDNLKRKTSFRPRILAKIGKN